MQSIFKILTYKDLWRRISNRSPQSLLTRTCTRSARTPRGLYQDLFKIFSQDHATLGSPRDLFKDLTGSRKDLLERTSPGSPRDPLISTCARSCKDLLDNISVIFTRFSYKDLYEIMQGPLTGSHQSFTTSSRPWPTSSYITDL